MENNKIKHLKKKAEKLPALPGVYLMKTNKDGVLYVGKAKSLRARVQSYFNEKSSLFKASKAQFLIRKMDKIDYIVTENEVEAFLLEASLIKRHRPRYNIRLKDDKAYPYIRFSAQDDFPRFYVERKIKDSRSVYFGPYTESGAVRALIDLLNQAFYLRDCSNSDFKSRTRPCLSWEMGICPAPCVRKITKSLYQKNGRSALNFLKGKTGALTKKIKSQMRARAKELKFEEALRLRDSLRVIERIEQSQSVFQNSDKDRDVAVFKMRQQELLIEILHFRKGRLIGNRFHFFKKARPEEEFFLSFLNQYYADNLIPDELLVKMPIKDSRMKLLEKALSARKGQSFAVTSVCGEEDLPLIEMAEKNAESHLLNEIDQEQSLQDGLLEIKRRLNLPRLPRRMECYDVSHWKGMQTVGSQVVFENGLPSKKNYRLYNLTVISAGDDYLALKQLLRRRLQHTEYENLDMILIDGGKGQLKAVQTVLKSLKREDIPLSALAKDRVKKERGGNSTGERFYIPGRKNHIQFSPSSKALRILLHLRDEAHRFAISSHRKKRNKAFLG